MRDEVVGRLNRTGLAAGLVAMVVMLAVMLFIRAVLEIPSLPEMIADAFTLVLPVSVFSILLGALEARAKFLLVAGLVIGHLVLGALLGMLYARVWGRYSMRSSRGPWPGEPWTAGLLLSAGMWIAATVVVMPAAGAGVLGLASRVGPFPLALSTLAASVAFGISLVAFFQGLLAGQPVMAGEIPKVDLERRALIMRLATVPVALILAGGLWQLLGRQGTGGLQEMEGSSNPKPRGSLPDEITPVGQFYNVSKNLKDPVVNITDWSMDLRVQGGKRLTLKYDDLKSLPSVEQVATLICISNELGGDLIGNARWTGVRLRDLLARVGATSGVDVVLRARDGYADSIPFEKAMQEGTVLAYRMNGQPLTSAHGFPARLIVPGIYGMKNVKWVTAIEVVDHDFKGYWQERGWSDVATINTMSRLDVPAKGSTLPLGPLDLGGIAFAGDRGISKVEVSADAGSTWMEMTLKQALSPYAWSLWTGRWEPSRTDDYVLLVRAWDGQGQVQERTDRDPLPDGATGYDSLPLTLR